jgi:FixJ family two-component response regulator
MTTLMKMGACICRLLVLDGHEVKVKRYRDIRGLPVHCNNFSKMLDSAPLNRNIVYKMALLTGLTGALVCLFVSSLAGAALVGLVVACEVYFISRWLIKLPEPSKPSESVVSEALADLAIRVGHDIRSPLTALEMVSSSLDGVAEEKRTILRGGISRIRDIANSLVIKYPKEKPMQAESEASKVYLLSSLIDVLLSEKRLQYRSQIGLEIEGSLGKSAYGIFVKVPALAFKRALSDLVNNAAGAVGEGNGSVKLSVELVKNSVRIEVRHDGKRASMEGLARVKTAIESWGGKILAGGQVLTLPLVPPPNWFVPAIRLTRKSVVVVVDDDSSIHQIWQRRFETLAATVHFSLPSQFLAWFEDRNSSDYLFLIDYEFMNDGQSGLDVIRNLGIQVSSILVTSHFEEPAVVNACSTIGVRMIPKGQAGHVPIETVEENDDPNRVILIDDDPLVRQSWEMRAEQLGGKIKTFSSATEFFTCTSQIQKDAKVFIDSNLGAGMKGEDLAKLLHEKGFLNLYLATGYAVDSFQREPWLRGILDKNPPEWLFRESKDSPP